MWNPGDSFEDEEARALAEAFENRTRDDTPYRVDDLVQIVLDMGWVSLTQARKDKAALDIELFSVNSDLEKIIAVVEAQRDQIYKLEEDLKKTPGRANPKSGVSSMTVTPLNPDGSKAGPPVQMGGSVTNIQFNSAPPPPVIPSAIDNYLKRSLLS